MNEFMIVKSEIFENQKVILNKLINEKPEFLNLEEVKQI